MLDNQKENKLEFIGNFLILLGMLFFLLLLVLQIDKLNF
jgi:hypothetical protein